MSGLPLDPNTRILTKKGWKGYQDYIDGSLTVGEDIYTFEPSSRTFKWEPLVAVVTHGSGPLVKLNIEPNVINNKGISLVMGERVPWIVEVTLRTNRRLTGYDGIKLREIDKTRRGIGELKKSNDIGTTYRLFLGEMDNLVTHRENDARVDLSIVNVGGGGSGITWTPYNTNETLVVLQNDIVFCVGTLSLRDGLDAYVTPPGTPSTLPTPIDAYIPVNSKAIQIRNFSGFSPISGVSIKDVILRSIPPINQGVLYLNGNPINIVPTTLSLEDANRLIYIPEGSFIGNSIITFDVVDTQGNTSSAPGTIDLGVTSAANEWENTISEIKALIEDLPNVSLSTVVDNIPNDYGKESTLEAISNKLDNILDLIKVGSNTTLTSSVLTDEGIIPGGYVYIDMEVTLGPVVVAGRTYQTGGVIKFEAMPFRVHPAIPYNATGGSISFMGAI